MNNLIVQKYGGSSLATLEQIDFVTKKIKKRLNDVNKIVIVVSAMGDTTDELVALSENFLKDNKDVENLRDFDQLLSTGEIISASLMSMSLRNNNVKAVSLTGQKAGIYTDELHGSARIASIDEKMILNELINKDVVIVAGFQGVSGYGEVTTLGRGGSDTTAVAIASALNAEKCEIYTDVKGIFTADPRLVKDSKLIRNISYNEMLEMASLGAKMHPRSIEIAAINNIEMIIKHTMYESEGTKLNNNEIKMEIRNAVTGIPTSKGVSKVTINNIDDKPGIASSIFLPLSEMGISVDVIVQTAGNDGKTNLSFTLNDNDLESCVNELIKNNVSKKEFIKTQSGLGKISIVGTGIQNQPGYASRMFKTLSENNINIEMITTSEIRITCIIKSSDLELAAKSLHKEFIT
ncbi:MAG: aspartate kinase [Chloroflexota bacterium]|nr:aspartate kinase [Chloroflexota bacterium]|tara:strand:- start:1922 stop:3142 length:1221 start_codon:yes stop_codon:yes gene_type:complete